LPAALAALFQAVKRINSLMANGRMDARGAGRLIALLRDIDAVLSIFEFDESRSVNPETRELVAARQQARAAHDWVLADRLRAELEARGFRVQDSKMDPSTRSRT
jgi:cysteinyl-tRNA synthetase